MATPYPPTELSETLKAARKARPGLTQHEVAAAIGGVPFTYISRWERAEVRPDIENLMRLAEFYDLDLAELVRMRAEAPASGRGRRGRAADPPTDDTPEMRAAEKAAAATPSPPQGRGAPEALRPR